MDLMLQIDGKGHLVCTLVDGADTATVVAADPADAAQDLEAALADARESGYGECVWPLTDGEYKWMFRRESGRLEVVVLWSSGTLTGWEHVFRSSDDAAELDRQIGDAVRRIPK